MIIKKWNSTLPGTDKWEAQAVETTAQSIKTTMGGTAIFDSNNKILPNHLPDSVFDSLYFYGVTSETSTSSLTSDAFKNALETNRSPLGYYYVAGQGLNLEDSTNYFGIYYSGIFYYSGESNQLTLGNTANLKVGMQIEGTGIQFNTKIASITNSTTLVMDKNVLGQSGTTDANVSFGYYFSTKINIEEAHTYTRNFTLTQNSGTITGGDTTNLKTNMFVTGEGIQGNGVVITSITNATTLSLSSLVSQTGVRTLTFAPSPYSSPIGNNIVSVELGDWFVLSKLEGEGTYENPYNVVIAVVNNTYEIMKGSSSISSGAPGLVPGSALGDQLKFLRADGTWQLTPDNNTATAANNILAGSNSETQITYAPYSTNLAATGNRLYTTTDVPTATTRLNLSSYLWATRLHSLDRKSVV